MHFGVLVSVLQSTFMRVRVGVGVRARVRVEVWASTGSELQRRVMSAR